MLQDLNRILKNIGRKFFAGALSSGTAAIHLGLIFTWNGRRSTLSKHDFAASANPILYLELSCIY
jgi:dTDP-4-amino-4,6-dideoxygalactose transaminase